jgi:YD repeat-containing protein
MKRHALGSCALAVLLTAVSLAATAQAETGTYTYDGFGRLKTVTRSSGAGVTYTYDDNSNRSTVVVTGGQTNPVAVTDTVSTAKNVTLNFDPRSNDTDANGNALTVTAKTNGSHGTVSIAGSGTGLSYVPASNYTGSDSFTYTIGDGHGATAVGTVNVTVTP